MHNVFLSAIARLFIHSLAAIDLESHLLHIERNEMHGIHLIEQEFRRNRRARDIHRNAQGLSVVVNAD